MIHQDINFKICVSLFGWKENILPKEGVEGGVKSEQTFSRSDLSMSILMRPEDPPYDECTTNSRK